MQLKYSSDKVFGEEVNFLSLLLVLVKSSINVFNKDSLVS